MSLLFVLFACVAYYGKADEDTFTLEKVEHRNIILLGKSRAGKTTLIEVLKNETYRPDLFSILSKTESIKVERFTMQSKKSKSFHFNILDTPGLFEVASDITERTTEVILNVIKKCIDKEITQIHHVYYVMSIQNGLSKQDLQAFDSFTDLFVGMKDKISIILSFAQNLSEKKEEEHFIKQFEKIPEFNSKIKGRIFFLGAAQTGAMYNNTKLEGNVCKQRNKLFQHMIEQKDTYNLKKLQIYTHHLASKKKCLNQEYQQYDDASEKRNKDNADVNREATTTDESGTIGVLIIYIGFCLLLVIFAYICNFYFYKNQERH